MKRIRIEPWGLLLACTGLVAAVVVWAQTPQTSSQNDQNLIQRQSGALRKMERNPVGGTSSGPSTESKPEEVQTPVASPPLQTPGPPRPNEIPGMAPGGTPPGTIPGPPSSFNAPEGLSPGPIAPGTEGGVGAAAPQAGAPGLGGVLGPGATPNPGGVPAPYAKGGPEQTFFLAPPDPKHGENLIRQYGCGSCHTIPGIRAANGLVGPPLTGVARRVYIGGVIQNSLQNRAMWIQNPQAFVPNVVMPTLGLSLVEAQDVSAYLQRLQ